LKDPADAKCMRDMVVIFSGLFGVFVALVMIARMVA
jgi:cytoplasmic iron level regulating protein YaaA (DUF328/UPF0246 family)